MNITTIGIDLAKNVFQVCGVNACGKAVRPARVEQLAGARDPLRTSAMTRSDCPDMPAG